MIKFLIKKASKNFEIISLVTLILIAGISTSYFNYKKNSDKQIYNNIIDNVYLNKTLKHIVKNLDPKYRKVKNKIKSGETFDKILESYSIKKEEIIKIKNSLNKNINLNKLNTNQTIQFSLDKTSNKINQFIFQISNTQKIFLSRNNENDIFNEEIIAIKLNKKIIYKENLILQKLALNDFYDCASAQPLPHIVINHPISSLNSATFLNPPPKLKHPQYYTHTPLAIH